MPNVPCVLPCDEEQGMVEKRISKNWLSSDCFQPDLKCGSLCTNGNGTFKVPANPAKFQEWGTHSGSYGGIGMFAFDEFGRKKVLKNIAKTNYHYGSGILNPRKLDMAYTEDNTIRKSAHRVTGAMKPNPLQIHMNGPLGLPLTQRKLDPYIPENIRDKLPLRFNERNCVSKPYKSDLTCREKMNFEKIRRQRSLGEGELGTLPGTQGIPRAANESSHINEFLRNTKGITSHSGLDRYMCRQGHIDNSIDRTTSNHIRCRDNASTYTLTSQQMAGVRDDARHHSDPLSRYPYCPERPPVVKVARGGVAKHDCCTTTARVDVADVSRSGVDAQVKPRSSPATQLYPQTGLYPKALDRHAYKDWGQYYDSRSLSGYPEYRRPTKLSDPVFPA